MPISQGLHLCHLVQGLERLNWYRVGKRHGNFVVLDVLELGHAADTHQSPLADDGDAVAHLLDLRQDMRGEKDCASIVAHFFDHAVKLLLVERVQAISRLIQDEQARAVHKGLNDSELALIAGGILAELAAGIKVQPGDQLLEIGLIDAPAQVPEVFENLPAGQAGVKRKLARQIADQPLDLHRLLPAVQPGNCRAAAVGVQQTHQHADGGGFARAVGSQEAKDFALLNSEGHIHNAPAPAVAFRELICLDNCRHRIAPFSHIRLRTSETQASSVSPFG